MIQTVLIPKNEHEVQFDLYENHVAEKFRIQNRRFLGNKYKLLCFIEDIVQEKCNNFESFCDIFAGTGVVGERFNNRKVKIITNDSLFSNYISLKAFIGATVKNLDLLREKIKFLNSLNPLNDNYVSIHYGSTYFTVENARKIGAIREKIEEITKNEDEKAILITSLLYATDKVANTVGHYDAFRKKLDMVRPIKLLVPDIDYESNFNNEIFREDANDLIKKISCDVLYIDPPYNSRQYCDTYHLLENVVTWRKPKVHGKAKKMNRAHLKSEYCFKTASKAFTDLISNARCKHILISYNNTGTSRDGRSNARISDEQIINALKGRGNIEIFERNYKAFTAGKSNGEGHTERVFYCNVKK